MIVLLLLAAPLSEAARIFGFKPFSMNSDSLVKAKPLSSLPSIEERTPYKAVLELKEHLSRRESLESKHPGSKAKLEPNVSAEMKASHQRSDELLQKTIPSLKFDVVDPEMKKPVKPFRPLGHSPGIGHGDTPGSRK